ncbi:hypothetical protein [Corynebacterium ulcerans]|uniref:hypothetical protein n=1 Tax=Corynebacterium ulcerans TaxID=65058 RepID=UPI000C77D50C|nr:hypothetical protein [Corynebacterium ulcerans]PLW02588.1 hypothetical protein BRL54_06075 [Corynebacterium ulcerans]
MVEGSTDWTKKGKIEDGKVEIVVESVRPLPPEVALLFSEGIHHLRAILDNVVWQLLVGEQGEIADRVAWLVEFPIKENQDEFSKWLTKRTKRLFATCGSRKLADRIKTLQPFVDTMQEVGSFSERLAHLSDQDPHLEHPLRLLRAYSNQDKHRQLRLTAARSVILKDSVSIFQQDRSFSRIEVGSVIDKLDESAREGYEISTAIMLQRPGNEDVWVGPARELSSLRRYVSDIAVPILLKGLEVPGLLPPVIGLGDTGQDFLERLDAAGTEDAIERLEEMSSRTYIEAMLEKPTFL